MENTNIQPADMEPVVMGEVGMVVEAQPENGRRRYRSYSLEDRQKFIADMNRGRDLKEAAASFNITRRTAHRIWTEWCLTGEINVQVRGGYRKKKLENHMIRKIQDWVDKDCSITLKRLQSKIARKYDVNVCESTISNYIGSFRYSFKRVLVRPSAADTEELWEQRREFALWFVNEMGQGKHFIFADEVGFQVSMRVAHGRSPKNTTPILRGGHCIKTRNITVMAAISESGVVHYQVLDGNGNKDAFMHFLDRLAEKRDEKGLPQDSTVVMDNVPFHKGSEVREIMEVRGLQWKFLPPYTPYFNAIENTFSQWKNFAKRGEPLLNEEDLKDAINDAANRITVNDCVGYVRHVHTNCMKVIRGEKNMT